MTEPTPPHRRPEAHAFQRAVLGFFRRAGGSLEDGRGERLLIAWAVRRYAQPFNVTVMAFRREGERRGTAVCLMSPDAAAPIEIEVGVPDHVGDVDPEERDDWLYSSFIAQLEERASRE